MTAADKPTRRTAAGRAYLDLQSVARSAGRDTAELLQIYALEGFLARLSCSAYADRLVLKGGLLLAAFDARRPTRDIDMAAMAIHGEQEQVLRVTRDIAKIDVGDGLAYSPADATALAIRDDATYGGIRITMPCRLDRARMRFHVDVNIGDPIWPAPRRVALPRLLGGALQVVAYPMAMVLAEKIVTAVQRGQANTRWRDYADIYLLSQLHDQSGRELTGAVKRVADHRRVRLWPLVDLLSGYAELNQQRWRAWLRRQQLEGDLPEGFDQVINLVIRYADPVIDGTADKLLWSRSSRAWVAGEDRSR